MVGILFEGSVAFLMLVVGTARSLGYTNNPALFQTVIASNDELAKIYLAENPHLSHDEFRILANNGSRVREAVARSKHVPLDVLAMLRADKEESVQIAALRNDRTTVEEFSTAVLTGKFSLQGKKYLAGDEKSAADLEVFEYLWKVKGTPQMLISALDWAVCRSSPVDSRIFGIIHETVRSGEANNTVREAYAEASYVSEPEILDSLKTDSHRPVINAIARNKSAWVSTHEYLATHHKTPSIRISVATATEDNDLLNKIYRGTKSEDIRSAVERNSFFTEQ